MANGKVEKMTVKKPNPLKEMVRKFFVALKRRPQMIPLVTFVIAFLVYTLNLSQVSNTTAKLQSSGMGLAGFAVMLFSMLSLVSFMNAFPYRKPVNKPMLILMFVMNAIIIVADAFYINTVNVVQSNPETMVTIVKETAYIVYAQYYLTVHIVVLAVALVLTALLPVYSKLLRKINTNIEVEGNADMGTIDLAGDD